MVKMSSFVALLARAHLVIPLLGVLIATGCVAPPRPFEVDQRLALRSLDDGAWDSALRRTVDRGDIIEL